MPSQVDPSGASFNTHTRSHFVCAPHRRGSHSGAMYAKGSLVSGIDSQRTKGSVFKVFDVIGGRVRKCRPHCHRPGKTASAFKNKFLTAVRWSYTLPAFSTIARPVMPPLTPAGASARTVARAKRAPRPKPAPLKPKPKSKPKSEAPAHPASAAAARGRSIRQADRRAPRLFHAGIPRRGAAPRRADIAKHDGDRGKFRHASQRACAADRAGGMGAAGGVAAPARAHAGDAARGRGGCAGFTFFTSP